MEKRTLHKILLVEDEADIRDIIQIALEDLGGFTVHYCVSGKEAIQIAESFQPDLLLLDVMMPEMDGPTTLKELRKIPSLLNVPCIFMTAKTHLPDVDPYQTLSVLSVINKPFDPMTLAAKIRECWDKNLL